LIHPAGAKIDLAGLMILRVGFRELTAPLGGLQATAGISID
jgi:hypothetical protein